MNDKTTWIFFDRASKRILTLFLVVLPFFASAQLEEFLLLEKPGTKSRIRYYIGDEIEFKIVGQKEFLKGTIVQFSDTSFYVNEYTEVKLPEVEALADRSKVKTVRSIAKTSFIVIPAIFVLSAANNLFNSTDSKTVIGEEVYPVAGGFAALGLAGMIYKGRKYRLKNRWRIIMVRH